jgi:hypothetical protein
MPWPPGDGRSGTVEPFRGQSIPLARQLERETRLNPPISAGTGVDEEKATEGIMALHNIRRKGTAAAAVIGLGALLVGCAGQTGESAFARTQSNAGFGETPISVACEPNQRAVVRQVAVNGTLQAQVQCSSVSAFAPVGTTGSYGETSPVAYAQAPGFQPVAYTVPAENTRLVRTAYPQEVVTRQAAARRAVSYQPAPERVVVRQPKRSVKKSAIIIGSSAGVGAGIGAAVGGKKGAGIGALLGGGGAAVWDQITRRK